MARTPAVKKLPKAKRGRPSVESKCPQARYGWKRDLLHRTRINTPALESTMNRLLFVEGVAREADGVYRRLLAECGGDESTAFDVLIGCAKALFGHEEILATTPDHNEARVARKVLECYRYLFDAEDASHDTKETFKAIIADLDRRATVAGRKGRLREFTIPQRDFILLTRFRPDMRPMSASLFKMLFRFMFRKDIHPADIKYDMIRPK